MNDYIKCKKGLRQFFLVLFSLAMLAGSSFAVTDVYLVAREYQRTLPGLPGAITMWGFAEDADGNLITDGGEIPTSPGPVITIPPGETTLNIHLRNDLVGVFVSIIIPGLPGGSFSPVWTAGGLPGPRPDPEAKVYSMTKETAPGATEVYTWSTPTPLKPGTYIYHSGNHQAVQGPLGRYGAG